MFLVRAVPGWVVVGAGATAALVPQLSRPGPEMDEGIVLAYADRVLHGAVPYRDFFTLYGPANLWNVATAFALFGTQQIVERAVGLAYVAVAATALYILVRRASRAAAVTTVIVAVAIAADAGVWPYASWAAIPFLVLSIVLSTARERPHARHGIPRFALAGFFAGWALLCRFDLVLSVVGVTLAIAVGVDRRRRISYLAALAATSLLYLPYVLLSGPGRVLQIAHDIHATSSGRRLPLPGTASPDGTLFWCAASALVVSILAAVHLWRSKSPHARALIALVAATVGAIPIVIFRPDKVHVEPFAVLALSALLLASSPLRALLRPSPYSKIVPICTALWLFLGVGPLVAGLAAHDASAIQGGTPYPGVKIVSNKRSFIVSNHIEARGTERVLSELNRLASRGDTVFIGPSDLRRSFYGPTFLYFLVPQLRPASYFMEFNPWVANRPGSRLAQDVEGADWLILDTRWRRSWEPNAANRLGPDTPNRIVRRDFCLVERVGSYRLYSLRTQRSRC